MSNWVAPVPPVLRVSVALRICQTVSEVLLATPNAAPAEPMLIVALPVPLALTLKP
jgi:hypothetical protein